MKVRCDRKALLDDVVRVAGVTASRNTRPILQHVLLSAREGTLELVATDLELAVRVRHEIQQGDEDGEIALPARKLLEILRESRGETIDVSTDGHVALIRTTGGQFRLSGLAPEDFPEVPTAADQEFVPLPAAMFRELTERTEFAASRELGRYAINGVLVEIEGRMVRFVSTNGRRLALAEATLEEEVASGGREILPLSGLQHFLKAIDPESEVVGVSFSGRRTMLKSHRIEFVATSVEAEFPDFQGVVSQTEGGCVVQLDRDSFFSCVRQAAIMSGDDSPTVSLAFSEGSLVVSSRVKGVGDARSEMAVDYAGNDLTIGFNPTFLLDFSKVTLPDQLPFAFQDESSSCVFRPDEGFVYVVMPISA